MSGQKLGLLWKKRTTSQIWKAMKSNRFLQVLRKKKD
jgi:hypothetical protein